MEKRRGMYITIFVILFLNRVKNHFAGECGAYSHVYHILTRALFTMRFFGLRFGPYFPHSFTLGLWSFFRIAFFHDK